MKVCFVTSECIPFAKAGGLGDVSGALPGYLRSHGDGIDIRLVLPLYGTIDRQAFGLTRVAQMQNLQIRVGSKTRNASVWEGSLPRTDVPVYFIESQDYFDRPHIYSEARDESTRFIFFQRAVFALLLESRWIPDVIHVNDWPTALIPALKILDTEIAEAFSQTATALSIHNIGYQGVFHQRAVQTAGLPAHLTEPFQPLEYYGRTSFLKAGIRLADVVATVSPTYAREIQTPEFGMGLDGDIRVRTNDVFGILNGIDLDIWNPEADSLIPVTYGVKSLNRKRRNTAALRTRLELTACENAPVIGIVSRLTEQKGFSLLSPILEKLLASQSFCLAVVGNGDPVFQNMFAAAKARFPGRVGTFFGYDESLAHLVEAGSDMFLMPSLYEPCGLNQMYSLRYGTIPIVRKTGGLADTVIDVDVNPLAGNGFVFTKPSPLALQNTVIRACKAYNDVEKWQSMQRRGMTQDFSWESSARAYIRLYESAVQARAERDGSSI